MNSKNEKLEKIRLGDYIERFTDNNKDLKYGYELIEGVTSEGVFSTPKGNTEDVNLKPYKVVRNGAFVYNPSRLNLGSIAYRTDGLCIVSHLYIVFYLNEKGKERIDPDYLYMYLRRKEFYREVTFRNFGSQRPEFNFNDMCEIELFLPDINTQKRFAAVYRSMVETQKAYELGLEDLKLVCDGYIEELRRKMPSEKIGNYIQRHDVRNGINGTKNVKGISTSKCFREPTSKVNKNELANYKVCHPRQIAFVQTTHNEKVFTYAFNNTEEDIVVSSVNEVFSTSEDILHPEYLCMFFNRTEFDRYARFHSWGSARETFTWNDLVDVEIPIPNLAIQKAIASVYNVYTERKELNEILKRKIKDICPILIKGSLEESRA